MGGWGPRSPLLSRALPLAGVLLLPLFETPFAAVAVEDAALAPAPRTALIEDLHASMPLPPAASAWVDTEAGLQMVPPAGWQAAPASSLNPVADPPEPTLERIRFQLRVGDPTLYAVPVPVTSALVRDAGAIISLALAREGTDLASFDFDPVVDAIDARIPGFVATEEESVYDDLHILARYLVSRTGERRVVVRAYAAEDEWPKIAPAVRAALATLRADPEGANAEPPPVPEPVVAVVETGAPAPVVDQTVRYRNDILARASLMLGTPYVWGGNMPGRGMDCSAYVSAAWGVARYTTDSIFAVAYAIAKEELRPGDAMNVTIGRDPARKGHIRLFEAWANEAHTLVWVYEETPPRAVHRVIAYDDRYLPIRLGGLSAAGSTGVIAAPPAPVERIAPAPSSGVRRTPTPTARPTPRPTARPATAAPVYVDPSSGRVIGGTAKPPPVLIIGTPTPRPTATPAPRTPAPTVRTPAPTIRRTTATATRTPAAPTRTPTPTRRPRKAGAAG